MPRHQQKNRWSADVTAHSDALDLEQKVFEKKSAAGIAKSLKRSAEVERPAEIKPVPVGHVDVDLLYQSRGAKPSCRAETYPRIGEGKVARAVRTQAPSVVPRTETSIKPETGLRERITGRQRAMIAKPTPPPRAEPPSSLPHNHTRDNGQPHAKEVDDYKKGVAVSPEEQGGREARPSATRTKK